MPTSESVPPTPDAPPPKARKARTSELAKARVRKSTSQVSTMKPPSVIVTGAKKKTSSLIVAKKRTSELSRMQKATGKTSAIRKQKSVITKSPDAPRMRSPDRTVEEDASRMLRTEDASRMLKTEDASRLLKTEDGSRMPRASGISQLTTVHKVISADETVDECEKKGSGEKKVNSKEMDLLIPKTHNRTIDVTFHLDEVIDEDMDIEFSYSMVVRRIGRESPLFSFLLVGDQVVEVNNEVVMSREELLEHVTTGKTTLTLVRPWNVRNLDDRVPVKFRKDSSYSLIEIHKFSGMKNGFDLKQSGKKFTVTSAPPKSRGGFAFFKNDRLLDVDSVSVGNMDLRGIRTRFNDTMKKQGKCSFLVERDLGLRSSGNPSLCCARATSNSEPKMGDDACEIGAREATRVLFMMNRYKPKSILKDSTPKDRTMVTAEGTIDGEEEVKYRRKRRKKNRKKGISIDGKSEVSRMPSDVEDPSGLHKVTPKSGLLAFMRTMFRK